MGLHLHARAHARAQKQRHARRSNLCQWQRALTAAHACRALQERLCVLRALLVTGGPSPGNLIFKHGKSCSYKSVFERHRRSRMRKNREILARKEDFTHKISPQAMIFHFSLMKYLLKYLIL